VALCLYCLSTGAVVSYARARADYHRTVAALPGTGEVFTRAAQAAGLPMR